MRDNFKKREKPEFEQRLVDLARVTRVMAGGKRLRFRACVVIGDSNKKIGWGIAKGADVSIAINKAVNQAKKDMMIVNTFENTIAHEVMHKFKAAKVFLKPAPEGRGVIAGGVIRDVLELAGIKDIIAKMYGSKNKVNNVRCVFQALKKLRKIEETKEVKEPKASDDKEVKVEESPSTAVPTLPTLPTGRQAGRQEVSEDKKKEDKK